MKLLISLCSLLFAFLMTPSIKKSRLFPKSFFEPHTQVYDLIIILALFAILYVLLELALFIWKLYQLHHRYHFILHTKMVPPSEEKRVFHDEHSQPLKNKHGKIILHLSPLQDLKIFHLSLITNIPPILTALGIFGTFLGISNGLQSMGSFNSLSSNKIIELIAPLLGGMSTAFHTSLLGIGAAILVIVFDKLVREPITRHGNHTIEQFFSQNFTLSQPGQDQKEQKNLTHEDIPQTLQSIYQKINQFDLEETHTLLRGLREEQQRSKEENTSIKEVLKKGFVAQIQWLEKIQKTQEGSQDTIKQLQSDINSQQEHQKNLVKFIEKLSQFIILLRNDTQKIHQSLEQNNEHLEGVAKSQHQLHIGLHNTAEQAKQIFEEQKSLISQTSHQVTLLGDFQQESTRQFSEIKKIFTQFQQEMGGFIVHLKGNLEEHRELFIQITEKSSKQIESVGQIATKQLEQVGDQLSKVGQESVTLLQQANHSVQETLQGVGEELERTGERVTSELERFREAYSTALYTFFERQQQLLEETLGQQRLGLQGVVERLEHALESETKLREKSKIEQEQILISMLEHEKNSQQHHQEFLTRLERVASGFPLLLQQSIDTIEQNSQHQLEASLSLRSAVEQLHQYSKSLPTNIEKILLEIVQYSEELQHQVGIAFENLRLESQKWAEEFFGLVSEKQSEFLSLHDIEASKIFDKFRQAVTLLAERTNDLGHSYGELHTIMNTWAASNLLVGKREEKR